MNPSISVISPVYNTGKHVEKCIKSIIKQSFTDWELILVNDCSPDKSVNIINKYVEKYDNIHLINHENNKGVDQARHTGINASKGEFLVFLSSHCLPENKDWLKNLLRNFKNKKVAGVYGKQSPLRFSTPKDIRDLYITFGNEKKIQKKDYFFHNANSAIRREQWKKNKFNEKLTNIEDREWGKRIIQNKYWLIYEPKANVFHYHGIHHGSNSRRLQTTIDVINKIEDNKLLSILPSSLSSVTFLARALNAAV